MNKTAYEKPEVQAVEAGCCVPIAESVPYPGGKGSDFEWGSF